MCRYCDGDGFILVGNVRRRYFHKYRQKYKTRKAEFSVRTAACPYCQQSPISRGKPRKVRAAHGRMPRLRTEGRLTT